MTQADYKALSRYIKNLKDEHKQYEIDMTTLKSVSSELEKAQNNFNLKSEQTATESESLHEAAQNASPKLMESSRKVSLPVEKFHDYQPSCLSKQMVDRTKTILEYQKKLLIR